MLARNYSWTLCIRLNPKLILSTALLANSLYAETPVDRQSRIITRPRKQSSNAPVLGLPLARPASSNGTSRGAQYDYEAIGLTQPSTLAEAPIPITGCCQIYEPTDGKCVYYGGGACTIGERTGHCSIDQEECKKVPDVCKTHENVEAACLQQDILLLNGIPSVASEWKAQGACIQTPYTNTSDGTKQTRTSCKYDW